MTDIVERLRNHDRHIRGRLIEGLTDLVIDDMVEAADEIERMRSWLINIQIDISGISDVCGRIADQVEKVRLGVSDD